VRGTPVAAGTRGLEPRIPQKRHGLVDAADIAERAAELEEAPRAEFAREAGRKCVFVQWNRLVFPPSAVVLAAASVELGSVDPIRRSHRSS